MEIAGAILDFDGTIADSLYVWREVLWRVTRAHGLPYTKEGMRAFFDAHEDLSTLDTCELVRQENPGIWDSAEEVYREMCAEVHRAYEHEVHAMPGVRRVLDELAGAHVPMAVASSTPEPVVRAGLAALGLAGCFADVVSTEDVGRDKEFPDVYLEAARRIGARPEDCWVFEDAPFGARTAHAAGFRVCALWNDHDGRDEDELRAASDILAHGWGEVTLALLEDYADGRDGVASGGVCRVLVVDGSPAPSSDALVRALAAQADYVVAADRGAEALMRAGVAPQALVGDSDSCDPAAAAWARSHARHVIAFPEKKYATDLGLALDAARHEAARRGSVAEVTLTCASGGRPDMALAVLCLLARNDDLRPRVAEDDHELRVLAPEGATAWELPPGAEGRTFSLVPLTDAVVSETGMEWDLDHGRLAAGSDEGVSNVVTGAGATVTCHEGVVAAFLLGAPLGPAGQGA